MVVGSIFGDLDRSGRLFQDMVVVRVFDDWAFLQDIFILLRIRFCYPFEDVGKAVD